MVLQDSRPTPNNASGQPAGLVYTQDAALGRTIDREVRPLCRIEAVTASADTALQAVETGNIDTCFVHLKSEGDDAAMALVRQLRRTQPDTAVFMVADNKNADLILEGLRLGVRDVILPTQNGDPRFLPALKQAMGLASGDRNGFVYAFFSLKGGQGVTTLSINLADQLQQLVGGRVLLLDLNLYMGDVGTLTNTAPDFTPFDLIRDLSRMDENLLFSSLLRHPRGFYVLPAPTVISDAERIHHGQIGAMLRLLKAHFTHIVIDLPHDFSERTLATVEASDRVMVLVEPDLVALKSSQQVLDFFQELNYGEDRIAVVLNRWTKQAVLQPEDVELVLKQSLLANVSNDWSALSRAARKGDPLGIAHGRRRITRDIYGLAKRLTGMGLPDGRRGFLGLLRRSR